MGPGADRLLQAARNMRHEIARSWRDLNDKEETPFTRIADKVADKVWIETEFSLCWKIRFNHGGYDLKPDLA